MNNIVLITGMAGSGKSTIGRRVAEHFSKSLLLQVDQLREMMVKGRDVPDKGFTEETYQQFQWARSTAIYMAHLYANQGVDVVIDDVCVPPNFVGQPRAKNEYLLAIIVKTNTELSSRFQFPRKHKRCKL